MGDGLSPRLARRRTWWICVLHVLDPFSMMDDRVEIRQHTLMQFECEKHVLGWVWVLERVVGVFFFSFAIGFRVRWWGEGYFSRVAR